MKLKTIGLTLLAEAVVIAIIEIIVVRRNDARLNSRR